VSDPIPFPTPASFDEKLARLRAKAEALADKPAFEVKFFLAKHAADVGVSPEQFEAAVNEVRKLRRKDVQAQTDREKVEARNARRRESKEKSRASLFRRLKVCPMSGVVPRSSNGVANGLRIPRRWPSNS
jgi:hypothetical protein